MKFKSQVLHIIRIKYCNAGGSGNSPFLIPAFWNIGILLHFVAFFHVASLLSTGVDNKKVGVDNEKALQLDNRIFFSYFSLILI